MPLVWTWATLRTWNPFDVAFRLLLVIAADLGAAELVLPGTHCVIPCFRSFWMMLASQAGPLRRASCEGGPAAKALRPQDEGSRRGRLET